MNGYAPRKRSPAIQGAKLAFSSPSSEKPLNDNHTGTHGALTAAYVAGRGGRKRSGGHAITSNQQRARLSTTTRVQDNANSYIAANVAARRSTELLPEPKASSTSSVRFRPSPQRAYSDMTTIPSSDGPSINRLIRRYEGTEGKPRGDLRPLQVLLRRTTSSNKPEPIPIISPLIPPMTAKGSLASHHPFHLPRSPSSSTASSYTSATDEPPFSLQQTVKQGTANTAYRPLKPPPRPSSILTTTGSSNTISNGTHRHEVLSNSIIPSLSADSLANAMVASSLATSRAPSPTKPPLPPPRRRSRPHLFHRTHSADDITNSRTPSPSSRTMRTTMRAPFDPNTDALVKQHRGNRFINKHPNKHHEGDRKRWRDQITEFERKRYEGVWAANRGLLTSIHLQGSETTSSHPTNVHLVDNGVLNIIVRDIWSRSNLPLDVLEEIWNLVDLNGTGLLGKEEFVVGMWLVDQRLKGRKLPVKVQDSVWFSARGLTGIKVRRRH
ncbi:MAG: hypothetical protein Q9218_001999 [Villophora microphyllina]